ncbi:MAG TPA: biotin--[acetyl-CoA-carboxylase] ligase [Candidatus Obscuribacter sp.]|nr:biotin--[acetyl-CoA-carboxylase] ligase [Candidatus Obscuribacter sp.]MBK9278080.1 biotin--[acetyl-CoA-carboxylase] ligase [Candidatus Obscuribacter sp.]HMW91480.1 biotin--[acetyl-CoA-carboxylase] ligase [Candidatus Obscuribacter sp.]HMY51352.1 biotin--[acetyl-CoA-carboxylase] ligase [Candidatus Obscuribacter sp.]HNA71773.1 biotin--[acetyl-CoA-carboxylase] ligase [Candidatus Obscuribacter sp.]
MTLHLDILDRKNIEDALTTELIGRGVCELHDTIDSTNSRAAVLAREGAPAGSLIVARQQTAGRGRQGRTWISPPDAGIAMSILLRPEIPLTRLPLITLATGVAVAQAVEALCGIQLGLKWVNDLTAGGKKVGGILAEMPGQALVIGIGINLRLDEGNIPDDLKNRIDWLENLAGRPLEPSLLVAEICRFLERQYFSLLEGKSQAIIDSWKHYSVTLGKEVMVVSPTGDSARNISGRAVDIAESGALLIEKTDGTRVELSAGEISLRSLDGSYC